MSLLAWHFSTLDQRLRFGDGRKIIPGETLSVSTPIELFNNGLHASENIIDALDNAPGPYIWRVELSGEMVSGYGQVAAEHRKALWGFDATDVLKHFARLCALDVIHLWDAPAVVREYLETGREDLRLVAASAARLVAGSAAWLASSTAWAADGVADWAARSARTTGARRADREKPRVRLEEMIEASRINC